MKQICRKVQDTLAAEGPRALSGDEAAQQHVAECTECFSFLESLSAIEVGLQSLPRPDAPDDVVESLLSRPEIADPAAAAVDTSRWGRIVATAASLLRPRPLVWGSVAAAFLIVVVAVGLRSTWRDSPVEQFVVVSNEADPLDEAGGEERVDKFDKGGELSGEHLEQLRGLGYIGDSKTEEGQNSLKQAEIDRPDSVRFYDDGFSMAPGVEDLDGDDRSNVHGSRSRDFKTVVGGTAGSKDDAEESKRNTDSIEEMERFRAGEEIEPLIAEPGADFGEANKNQPESMREPLRRGRAWRVRPESPSPSSSKTVTSCPSIPTWRLALASNRRWCFR
jgi:hypothetical protein